MALKLKHRQRIDFQISRASCYVTLYGLASSDIKHHTPIMRKVLAFITRGRGGKKLSDRGQAGPCQTAQIVSSVYSCASFESNSAKAFPAVEEGKDGESFFTADAC